MFNPKDFHYIVRTSEREEFFVIVRGLAYASFMAYSALFILEVVRKGSVSNHINLDALLVTAFASSLVSLFLGEKYSQAGVLPHNRRLSALHTAITGAIAFLVVIIYFRDLGFTAWLLLGFFEFAILFFNFSPDEEGESKPSQA